MDTNIPVEPNQTLESISLKITQVSKAVEQVFQACVTPRINTTPTFRDELFGRRQIRLVINLDTFTPQNLQNNLPEIERLVSEFIELRKMEKQLLEKVQIERQISTDAFAPTWERSAT